MSDIAKSGVVGGSITGAGAACFLGGIALEATEGIAAVICPPAGIFLGVAIGAGAAIGAISRAIFRDNK